MTLPSVSSSRSMNILTKLKLTSRRSKQFLTCATILSTIILFLVSTGKDQPYLRQLKASSCNNSSDLRFVGFWHIGGKAQQTTFSTDEIVQKQLGEIQSTHLFSECNDYDVTLNYVTRVNLSDETKNMLSQDERVQELPPTAIENMEDDEEYYEFTTLMEMHSYCQNLAEDVDEVVFYMHSKTHNQWRLFMENYLLGPECAQCLEDTDKMACGTSFISDKWIWSHFSGNFFMTRCSHIRRLNPPYTPEIMNEIHDIQEATGGVSSGFPHAYPPYGRFAAEYWVMNDAGERPDHLYAANQWPNLRNAKEGHHPSLIDQEQVCSKNVPKTIIFGPIDA
jgi:hypothetical protein